MSKVTIGDNAAFVELVLDEEQIASDFCMSVEVSARNFGGTVHDVWISPEHFHEFVNQLESLREDRQPVAELLNFSSGTSTDPLVLRISKSDPLGHLRVHATVRHPVIDISGEMLIASVSFEMDREFLNTVILDLHKLPRRE